MSALPDTAVQLAGKVAIVTGGAQGSDLPSLRRWPTAARR